MDTGDHPRGDENINSAFSHTAENLTLLLLTRLLRPKTDSTPSFMDGLLELQVNATKLDVRRFGF